jgi:hypothetical protein
MRSLLHQSPVVHTTQTRDIRLKASRMFEIKSTHWQILIDTQMFAHLFANWCLGRVRLVISGKVHVVYSVWEVMAITVVHQVRHKLVNWD